MSNDLKSNGEHAGGANNDFPKFAPGDNADKVLSASYQNKLIAGVERANRKTYGSGVINFGPVSLQKGQRRAPESGNRIRVRLDYPYRAPMGAVVGVDFPILDEAIEDQYDLVNFLNDPVTTYSCSKNQYRHHNRIAILEQELLPGQTGWAVISGVAKTFWHVQIPPGAIGTLSDSKLDGTDNTPVRNSNSQMDEYRHLGILGASYSGNVEESGSEHKIWELGDVFYWDNRDRPWWLTVVPRSYDDDVDARRPAEITTLYSGRVASSFGRAMGISGTSVLEVDCSVGSSTFVCESNQWRLRDSTCGSGCSSWSLLERYWDSRHLGMESNCTNGTVVTTKCVSEYPYRDLPDAGDDGMSDDEYMDVASSAAWRDASGAFAYQWLVGDVVLGTPSTPSVVDDQGNTDMFGNFYGPSGSNNGADPSPQDARYGYARACANLTCTYTCDGTQWIMSRGQTPYYLNEFGRCICPDEFMIKMSAHDLPCNHGSQPREFTTGMVLGWIETTTSTTTTSSTTTTTCSTALQCEWACMPVRSGGTIVRYDWTVTGCNEFDAYHSCECPYQDGVAVGIPCDAAAGIPSPSAALNCGDPPPPTGACELNANPSDPDYPCYAACYVTHEALCNAAGGNYLGDGTTCPTYDYGPIGGCCLTHPVYAPYCIQNYECACNTMGVASGTTKTWVEGLVCDDGGAWYGTCNSSTTTTTSSTTTTTGTSSTTTSSTTTTTGASSTTTSSTTTTTAAPTGACCISGVCSITTGADCVSNAGTYQGNDTTCSPDPCAGSSTTTSSSTTTTEGSSSTTTSSTTTTTASCGTCEWICLCPAGDCSWQFSNNSCSPGCSCSSAPPAFDPPCIPGNVNSTTNTDCVPS